MNINKIQGKHIAFCALTCALIIVGSKIQIPIFTVPITLQMPAVLLCVLILPSFLSVATIGVYIYAGLMGLPFFAGGGGFAYALNPSFGYLIGFLLASIIVSILKAKGKCKNLVAMAFIVLLITHVTAVFYTYFISNAYLLNGLTFLNAIVYSSLVFLPTDIIWCFICSAVAKRILKAINL